MIVFACRRKPPLILLAISIHLQSFLQFQPFPNIFRLTSGAIFSSDDDHKLQCQKSSLASKAVRLLSQRLISFVCHHKLLNDVLMLNKT